MNMPKTERINGALYLAGKVNSKEFISICETCKRRESCDEPDKERRITCNEKRLRL